MENKEFQHNEKKPYSNRTNQEGNSEHRHTKKPRYDKFQNKKFPFNLRSFVPEFQIENMHDNPDYIRVISYNTLADSLISISTQIDESDLINYPYMSWDNRKKNILAELYELNGDVLCIQEFERDEDFISALGKLGYDCAFKPRTGDHSEGCAIFWKNKKFRVENVYSLEFNMNQNSKNISEIYDRDNIAVFAVLQYISKPDVCFIISNTHILFNNNRGDIKLAQVYQILNSLTIFKNYYCQKFKKVNLILCGDFNSVPNSGVYKMITEGSVDCTNIDRRKISGQSQGRLGSIEPRKFKPTLLNYVTSKFSEEKNKNHMSFDNENWFNSITSVESHFDPVSQIITLRYKENYRFQNGNLKLTPSLTLSSAYATLLSKMLNFIKESSLNPTPKLQPPFYKIQDISTLDNSEVYGIKMGFADIDKTLSYVKNFTLEPPFSFYGKGMMALVDYIFYDGSMTPIRTLNIPDVKKVAFDIGYLPNEHFPSDHISLCADFQLLD